MKKEQFNKIKKFSDANGILAYLDKNVSMRINNLGLYEEVLADIADEIPDKFIDSISTLNGKNNEQELGEELFGKSVGIKYNPRIGYYLNLYAGHVIDDNIRLGSSSGAVTSWILDKLLSKRVVDYVIHVKQSESEDVLFEYGISRNSEELFSGSKTKYYPVELSKVLEIVRTNEGKYAIVGIPSFITSVRLLCKVDQVIRDRLVLTVGLICGHVKSSHFTSYLGLQCGIEPDHIEHIDYRVKVLGKRADKYSISVSGLKDGVPIEVTKSNQDLDGQDWGKGYFKAYSSDFVLDVMNETADITLGDAWLPEYNNDSLGNNIVIVRNEIIQEIIDEGIKAGELKLDIVSEKTIIDSQKAHYRHTQDEYGYRLKINNVNQLDIFKDKNYSKKHLSFERKLIQRIRRSIMQRSFSAYNSLEGENILKRRMTRYNIAYKYVYKFSNFKRRVVSKIKK